MAPTRRALSTGSRACGFSLLEVMIALGILAIVLLSVYRLHSQTIAMSIESRFATQAPLLARSALAQWEDPTRPQPAAAQGDYGVEFPGYRWEINATELISPVLGAEIARDLKRVEVRVTLNAGEYAYGFRTYRFRRE
ncbi:MAG: prepilin-type N-terminal cleavage/methylation domain-containing protein [Desulfobacterales bacterium]|jgi:prepilin-type N-terminal cleavage/methylation domain-containing protein|nr:prepilin-type N-terminal cleavage/methylation domain-containing protein [Desulfobacterales bacterium]